MSEKRTAQDRLVEVLFALEKNHAFGITNKELARVVETSEANACRDLQVLEKYELVRKDEKSRWRLTPRFGQFANSMMKSFQTAKLKLKEDEAEYLSAMQ